MRSDDRYSAYRPVLDDDERLQSYLDYRDRVFLAPRPLAYYTDALEAADFEIAEVTERTISARVDEWYEFLSAYADAVLGWVGGSARVDEEEPPRKPPPTAFVSWASRWLPSSAAARPSTAAGPTSLPCGRSLGLRRVHGIAQMGDTHTGDDGRVPEDDRCVRELLEQPHSCA